MRLQHTLIARELIAIHNMSIFGRLPMRFNIPKGRIGTELNELSVLNLEGEVVRLRPRFSVSLATDPRLLPCFAPRAAQDGLLRATAGMVRSELISDSAVHGAWRSGIGVDVAAWGCRPWEK